MNGASLGGAGPSRSSSAALCGQTRNYTSGQRVEETRLEIARPLSRSCLFRPRKFDPLFSYLVYHAPFPSNSGKSPSRPCAEEIRIEISTVSGQFYGFPFFKSKPTLWYKFLKSFVRGRIFSGGNSFERWFDRRISFFSRFVGIFFCFFSR